MTSSRDALASWTPPAFDPGGRAVVPAMASATADWALADLGAPTRVVTDEPPAERVAAWLEGHEAGVAEAERRVSERLEPVNAMLAPLLERLREAELLAIAERETNLIALALAVARHLVQRELAGDPGLAAELARRALTLMPTGAPVRVRVHPDDLTTLETGVRGVSGAGGPGEVRWEANPSLERGDFVLDGPGRIVDGRTDVALRNLYDRLTLH